MSPAVALVPSTACDEIVNAPSLTALQFDPSPPFARLKSSDARAPVLVHVTTTVVTFPPETVPEPLETAQVCPDGLLLTVTLYADPSVSFVANANDPLALTVRSSP